MKNGIKNIMKNKKILVGAVAVIVAIVLLITMICINLGKSQNKMSISTPELARAMEYNQFEEGDDAIDSTDNVKFSAFFLRDLDGDGYAEKIKGTCKPIGGEDTLYMEINVQTGGYLKDAKVEIQGQNFYLQTAIPKDEQLRDNYIGDDIKTIEFNQINNGTQKLLTGVIRSGDYSYASTKSSAIGNNINNYSREDNKIMLTGTYVNEAQEEIQITKEIQLTVDWYGTTKAEINAEAWRNTYYDLPDRINEENGTIKLDFAVNTNEANAILNLSKNHVEGTIPELNGYAPTEVKMTNTASANLVFSYDEATKTFSIDRTATVGEDGTVTTAISRQNNYNIQVTYPIEAYQAVGEDTVSISVPVQTYYEGYNNPNSQFTNPYKSNVAKATIVANYSNPVEKVAYVDIRVGKYLYNPSSRYMVSKQKPLRIYNGISEEEKNDTYIVRWYAYTGTEGETTGLVLKETKDGQAQIADEFIKTDSSTDSMENITTNIGIYFLGADNFLKEDGWIKVYDEETGNLLKTFTKDDWGKYTSTNPYKYELPVKHIRVETSATNKEAGLSIYNIKELNDEYITTNYTKEEFDNLQYIQSTLNGALGGNNIVTTKHQANYEAPYSLATIELSNNKISTQTTEEHEKITIIANYDSSSNQVGWIDGSFLVKLPEEILGVKINSVEIDNSSVVIATYELIEQDTGKFIKINTKNNNDTAQSYTITIDADITPDPRLASSTRTIELYASNNDAVEYYYKGQDIYDVNDNLNTEEIINKTSTSISLVSPGSLLTNQTASEYDSSNTVVVSPEVADITPRYAKVDNEKQTAKIGIQLKNNYSSTISEVVLLGKIPFEGNTTVVSGKNLNSEFTTKMLNTGITIPEELQGKVTVYYSENETPNRVLGNAENGWTLAENVTNWDNIKTFLIDFGDLVLSRGDEYVFYYTIEIPEGVEFNKISYSHHGIYFCLDTEEGKYRTQTEPNKIGFRIAEKFNLELAKTQTGKDKLVQGATYSVTEIVVDETTGEETLGDAKTAVTNAQGALTINKLYVERIYEIQEIKTPDDYELNSDIIRIIGHVDENGTLTIEKTQGTTKEDIAVTKNEGEMHKVTVKVEDEAKAKLKITKKEQGTENTISYVKYKLIGYGLPTSGRILTTNINGEATISGLKINEEYTLEETKATGYYLASPIKFKIVNNEGTYQVEIIEGTIAQSDVTEEDSLPIANLILEDEKIPTYNLEIFKIKKTIETTLSTDELIAKAEGSLAGEATDVLAGAKFRLYKDDKEIGEYITGEDGKITIENLYQYVDGKDENATYTLKEVLAPDGYAKVKDLTFKAQVVDSTLKLINIDGEEEKFTVEGSTIKLLIEDSPSFKLIKKDAETGEVLANVKFAIYNVDDGVVPATNSKGEIIGAKEIINGREYYTVTTDSNGIITADLTEGLYKAVEVQAPDKYEIKNKEYYFGIGASREGKTGLQAEWANGIGDGINYNNITSVVETSDGGYIALGYFGSNGIKLENGVTISGYAIIKYNSEGFIEWTNTISANIKSLAETRDEGYVVGGNNGGPGRVDGRLIKYNSEGNVEWSNTIGGSYDDEITSVVETSDGGYVVGGYFSNNSIDLGNGVTLTNNGNSDGMLIKYDSDGVVEWANTIGGNSYDSIKSVVETSDGGYAIGGKFDSVSIDLGNGVTLTNNGNSDGMLIKYNSDGEVEWAKIIGGSNYEYINSIVATTDGGYVVGGYFYSTSIDLGNGVTLTSNSNIPYYSGRSDGMLIKYSKEGEIEWAKVIGNLIMSVSETRDGGYVVGGYFCTRSIDLGNGITVTNSSLDTNTQSPYNDGMIIKYNNYGEAEWAKAIGGSYGDEITSVVETSDGGYVVGGQFSSSIDLGNGITLTKKGNDGRTDAMIIKFSKVEVPEIVIKKANEIGGSNNDYINSVVATSDGGYVVGGYFFSSSIDLGNGVTLTNSSRSGYSDGMIIKYNVNGEIEWEKAIGGSYNDKIESVVETRDGGYLVGGYFDSSIYLGNGITLIDHSSGIHVVNGMLIKYSADGEVEWAKAIGGSDNDQITSVAETRDGGYAIGGYFSSSSIDLGNGVRLTNHGRHDGMLIKYDTNGNVELAKVIGGSDNDQITSVVATSDGGYVVGGYFYSSSINLGKVVTLTNKSSSKNYREGVLIKYNREGEIEWAEATGGGYNDEIDLVVETNDGGYIVGGYFSNSTDLGNGVKINGRGIIKYNLEGFIEWANKIPANITSVAKTSDGGYIVGGYFLSSHISLGNGITLINNSSSTTYYDGMIIKYSSEGNVEWAKAIGGNDGDNINSVVELSDGSYIAGGDFKSSSIDLENGDTLTNNSSSTSYSDGMLIKIAEEMGVPEVQELTVENERKEFKITTDVNEIDGIKGGSISGEDQRAYEKIKYGYNSTKEITMIPNENYEIIGITVNGEEYSFTANEDGTYTMPLFTNVTEDKHIEVTYSLKDNKIIINKIDSETQGTLPGATFRLDQLEEREEPDDENIIGNLTDNGQEYDEIDTTEEVTTEILGELTDNGQEYTAADITAEVTGVLGELTNNGAYYFVEQEDGTLVPTNSKTYQVSNGGTAGIQSVTANSYIPIDLTNVTGEYVVIVNANVTSESADRGYATITETTIAPAYNSTAGQFIYISGTVEAKDYTSMVLQGGKIYYLHLGYRKDGSADTGVDQIVFNSIKVYKATCTRYNFVENEEGGYESTNQGQANTVSNSYIPIDLTSMTGKYAIVVNANVSSQQYYDYGYATITESTTAPAYNTSTGRFIYISGTSTTPANYTTVLEGGKLYYLHLGYYKNASTDTGDDKFTVNSVKVYGAKTVTYNFVENEEGKYESTIQGKDSRVANSYIPIDLTNYEGKYNLIVNANVSSQQYSDYGYATVTENTTRPEYYSSTGRFIYISGATEAVTTPTDYTTVLEGGELYYLHLGYYKNASTSEGDDKFTVNSISVTLNDSDLYHTEVTTNSEGQGITQIPFGKYSITETQAPEGYELNENSIVVEFRADENHEFTIENNKLAKVIVHHYIKDTTTSVAEDEILQDKVGYQYTALPHLDLEKYELEKDVEGTYIMPENATGQFVSGEQEVIYYYVEKEIPLIVNHYIEGTETPVPLLDGSNAETIISQGKEGEAYTTTAIPNSELSNEYELVEIPSNSTGTYQGDRVEVTYYYKKVVRNITINKYAEDGVTPLEGAKFAILNKDESKNQIVKTEEMRNNGAYYFEKDGNRYISNNKGKSNSTANSYIKIDLTKFENVNLTVNAEISSESYNDYGYATITESTTAPAYNSSKGQFIKISGTVSAKDYPTQLEGGKIYYLHLGYRKDGSVNTGTDTFTINSIKINGTDYLEKIYGSTYITNNQGKIEQALEKGEYVITEIQAPDGYQLSDNATREITISRDTEEVSVDITNIKKLGKVTVHYYVEGTQTPITLTDGTTAQDVIKTGNVGDIYASTEANNVASKYELVAVPYNSSGDLTEEEIVVIYYYRLKDTSVLVHHYKEGTTESLSADVTISGQVDDIYNTVVASDIASKYELVATPTNANGVMTEEKIVVTYYYRLKDTSVIVHYYKEGTTESLSADVTILGKADDEYETFAATDIESKYELVAIPDNANGVMTGEPIEVIYYYRIKTYNITTRVEEQTETYITGETAVVKGGTISGEGETPYEIVEHGENSTKQIVATPDDVHKVSKITINGVEQEFTENEDGTVTLQLFENVTEDKEIVVSFERIPTKIIVHHYIEGTTTKVPLSNGREAQDELYQKQYGETYSTSSISNSSLDEYYELTSAPINATGTAGNETIIVTYYYNLKDYELELTKYEQGTDKTLSGVSFSIKEITTEETREYTTDKNGKILINRLRLGQTYELQETNPAEGYLLNKDTIKFTTELVNGALKVKILEGSFKEAQDEIIVEKANGDNPLVKVSMENEPIFTLIKKGNERNNLLPGAKFVIKELVEENGTTVEKEAQDYYGNLVGQEEEINGEVIRVVTTDENGEINEPLKAGNYKITEVQAPENYVIGEENTYYFEVKKSQPRISEINKIWEGALDIDTNIIELKNGKYVGAKTISSTLTIEAEDTVNNQEIQLSAIDESNDSVIIKYNSNLKVENVKQIGASGWDWIYKLIATKDGGYVAIGEITGDITVNNGELEISTENSFFDGSVVIKYNAQDKIEWITKIDPTDERGYTYNENIIETQNGDFVIEGYADSTIQISAENTVNNQIIEFQGGYYVTELTSQGKVEWITNLSENYEYYNGAIIESSNGNYVISPNMYDNPIYLEISANDGAIIQERDVSEIENAFDFSKMIEPTDIELTNDGGIILVGIIGENQTIAAENTANGQDIELKAHSTTETACIIKFNSELKVEWAHTLNGLSIYTKVISETDREYTVIGLFAETLTIENDETANNEAVNLQAEGQNGNWLIVKYNSQGKIIYANGSEVYTGGDLFATDIMQISENQYLLALENSQKIFKETVQAEIQAEKVELEVINTYNPPVLTYEKEATITRRAEEGTLAENEVTAGDTITYVIKVHNTGTTKAEGIEVRDTAPAGTVLKTIENGGVETDAEIVWTIAEIEPNETAEVGFTVEVQYLRQETTIRNKATVEGKETNETENPYKKLPLVEESRVEKKATEKITTKDMKVYYEIKFTATINYFDGKAKIALVDTLPYPINVEESEIAGGTYDEATKTITWVEELNNLPVIIDGMTIERTKVLNLKYDYGNIDDITGALINKINSRIDLLEPSEETPDEYVGVKVDEREAIVETLVEIPTQVKVHHYIYDAEKNEYTTVKLVEDETINGIIGQEYQTSPSSSIKNYSPINTTPEKYDGKMTEEIIEVTYYYQLITPKVENAMEKTATASKAEDGVAILTNENGEVTYDINYNVTIKDYIGKATIEIVDTLPEVIDVQKSDLAGGRYDEATKTITWTENEEGIDTFTNGTFTKEITKQIKLVYSNQNVLQDLVNIVTGTTVVYYPESHTTKPGEELVTNTATDDETVKQEYKVTLRVNKKWMDNEDLKGKRPESVTIEIKGIADGEVLTEVLNAENGWMCEITDLPKYDAEGNKIIYEVIEKETEEGDLEFYEDSQITNVETQTEEATNYIFTVINAYKLLNTDLITELTKGGTEEITSSKDVVEYTIKIKVEVIDYIGAGKVRIVDTLPYKIDEENSDLAGGIYDDEQQTVTWEEELPHINTETLGESYKEDITKQIKVVYKNIDLSTDKMTNKVNGKVELYESEVKDEDETTHDTSINVDGKVIVRYVDKQTGKDIDENYNYEITEKVGADYTSEPKEIENYYYIESTNNEKGKIKEEDQEVIYYYIKTEATVLVKYQDTEGNELLPDVLISGKVLDNYTTEQKEIENYRFVSVTDNKEGVMTKEQIVVIYVYEKIPAKVIVKYIEKDVETGEEKELLPEETIEGFAGDDYKTERQVIENYKSAEPEPDNKTGKMTEEAIEVIYYYERIPSGVITVTYVDIDTKEEITYITETEEEKTYRYEIKGFVGDEYETEEKVISYYEFVESTENTEGVLTEKEDTVTYYYRKLTFNFSVEKTVAGITLNEKAVRVTNNKLTKVEVRAKQIANTELIVSYDINVKNDGELKGKANIVEIIPQGYEVINQEGYWKATNGALEAEVELDAGEERDLSVNLKWLNSENNIGTTTNIVKIDKIENAANYEEITTEDNTSSAQVIIGITTGPKFETIFKIELAMSVVIILLLVLNINEVSIIRKKK